MGLVFFLWRGGGEKKSSFGLPIHFRSQILKMASSVLGVRPMEGAGPLASPTNPQFI